MENLNVVGERWNREEDPMPSERKVVGSVFRLPSSFPIPYSARVSERRQTLDQILRIAIVYP